MRLRKVARGCCHADGETINDDNRSRTVSVLMVRFPICMFNLSCGLTTAQVMLTLGYVPFCQAPMSLCVAWKRKAENIKWQILFHIHSVTIWPYVIDLWADREVRLSRQVKRAGPEGRGAFFLKYQ